MQTPTPTKPKSLSQAQAPTHLPKSQPLYQSTYDSPVGEITLVAHDTALVGLWLEGQKYFARTLEDQPLIPQDNPVLAQAKSWLDAYFRRENPNPYDVPLDPRGTPFQLAVWQILATIPHGQVTTYGTISRQVAEKLGKTQMSAQAVGGAVGRNPISIIVPCHRVVGATGNLTGYAGGLDKKKFLLQLEGVDLAQFH